MWGRRRGNKKEKRIFDVLKGKVTNQFLAMMGFVRRSRWRGAFGFRGRTEGREDLFFFFWRTRPILVFSFLSFPFRVGRFLGLIMNKERKKGSGREMERIERFDKIVKSARLEEIRER